MCLRTITDGSVQRRVSMGCHVSNNELALPVYDQADVFKLMGEGVSRWTVMDAWDEVAKQSEAATGDAVSDEVPGGVRAVVSEAASSRQGPFKPLDDPASDDMGCFDFIYDCQVRGIDEMYLYAEAVC